MDLLFLGTSSGIPTRQRNVTALALQEETGSAWYLVDCGEGTQHRLLQASLSPTDLEAIFITHVHGDHCYGLPGLLASAGMLGRKRPLTLVGPAAIEAWLRATQEQTQLFLPFEVRFVAVESLAQWENERFRVEAYPLSHRVPSFAYRFTELNLLPSLDTGKLVAEGIERGPIWGKLHKGMDVPYGDRLLCSRDYLHFPYPARRVVVGGDNDRPELLQDACAQAQVLVHEATYTQEVAARMGDVGHSAAAAVAAFAESVRLPNLVLTHFSARYQENTDRSPSIDDIRREAEEHYQGRLFLAEDFARYRLSRSGELTRV
jgi:ribonuclease Z